MAKVVKWVAIGGVLFFVGYLLALTYRYEPVAGAQTPAGTISVWDRWNNRVCVSSISTGGPPMCSLQELSTRMRLAGPQPDQGQK